MNKLNAYLRHFIQHKEEAHFPCSTRHDLVSPKVDGACVLTPRSRGKRVLSALQHDWYFTARTRRHSREESIQGFWQDSEDWHYCNHLTSSKSTWKREQVSISLQQVWKERTSLFALILWLWAPQLSNMPLSLEDGLPTYLSARVRSLVILGAASQALRHEVSEIIMSSISWFFYLSWFSSIIPSLFKWKLLQKIFCFDHLMSFIIL